MRSPRRTLAFGLSRMAPVVVALSTFFGSFKVMRESLAIGLGGLGFICSGAAIATHQAVIGLVIVMLGAGCVGVAMGKRSKGN